MKAIIDTNKVVDASPLILESKVTIMQAIKKMIDKKKSVAIVHNSDFDLVGILTERDIFRKISLLDVEDKLLYQISTIMTRKVHFCVKKDLLLQVKELHLKFGVRHFPILEKSGHTKLESLVGIASATSIFRRYIETIV